MRRIGALMNLAADDPQSQARVAAFRQVLQQLGRSDRNVRIDTRWGRCFRHVSEPASINNAFASTMLE